MCIDAFIMIQTVFDPIADCSTLVPVDCLTWQVATAVLDLVLVLSTVIGTRVGRGPLTTLLKEQQSEWHVSLCIQVRINSTYLFLSNIINHGCVKRGIGDRLGK